MKYAVSDIFCGRFFYAEKRSKAGNLETAGCCALCALGVYTALQFLAAVLVAREAVGEAQAPALVLAAAGISAVVGVLVMGRACRTKRMLLGRGVRLGIGAGGGPGRGDRGNLPESGKQFAGIVAAAVGGGSWRPRQEGENGAEEAEAPVRGVDGGYIMRRSERGAGAGRKNML